MERLNWIKRVGVSTAVIVAVLALLALFGALDTGAAGPPPTAKPVRSAETIRLTPSTVQPEDHELFTIGHAMVAGQCAGPSPDGVVITKVTITAVGGDITITGGGVGPDGEVLPSGTKDAIIVIGVGPGDAPTATSTDFAVFDAAGSSFSGTAAAWVTLSGCVVTAQVAG